MADNKRFVSFQGEKIARELLRAEYRHNSNAAEIQRLRKAVFPLVYSYDENEKMRMLSAYGDTGQLSKKPSQEEINEALVEAIIVHLPPGDLQKLLQQASFKRMKLAEDLRRNTRDSMADQYRNPYKVVNNYFIKNNNTNIMANQKVADEVVGIPMVVQSNPRTRKIFKVVYRELRTLVRNFNVVHLSKIAAKAGIQISSKGMNKDELIKQISYLCANYVAMVKGDDKLIFPMDPATIKEIEDLLALTSYGYSIGLTSMTHADIVKKRQEFADRKKREDSLNRIRKADERKVKAKEIAQVAELKSTSRKNQLRELKNSDKGALKDKSIEELHALAGALEVIIPIDAPMHVIKFEIYQKLAQIGWLPDSDTNKISSKYIDFLSGKIVKFDKKINAGINAGALNVFTKRKARKAINAKELAEKNLNSTLAANKSLNGEITTIMSGETSPLLSTGSGIGEGFGVPLLALNEAGMLEGAAPNVAVPVYISDMARHLRMRMDSSIIDAVSIGSGGNASPGVIKALYNPNDNNIPKKHAGNAAALTEYTKNRTVEQIAETNAKIAETKAINNVKRAELNIGDGDKKDIRQLMNNGASRIAESTNMKYISKLTPTVPVYITNGFTEYLNDNIAQGFDRLYTVSSATGDFITKYLPVLFGGLQSIGFSVNASAASAAIAASGSVIDSIANGVFNALTTKSEVSNVSKFATGGSGSAGKANISQFITGDSLNKKPNEELVTVDWTNKRFNVKPTNNASTTTKSTGGNVSNVSRLTASERSSAMQVAFTEAMISYTGSVKGSTNDNLALKVYPVTPGFNDTIDYNGVQVSVMDLMYNINSSLSTLVDLTATGVELTSVIAKKPVAAPTTTEVSAETFPTNLDAILQGA